MTGKRKRWLPPATGWHWRLRRRDGLGHAHPLVVIVKRQDRDLRLAEAKAWLESAGRCGGIVGVCHGAGTILGRFFYRIRPAPGGAHLMVDRVSLLEPLGSHRTLAAVLRATRKLAATEGCREIRLGQGEASGSLTVEGMKDVGLRLGFVHDGDGWRCDGGAVGQVVVLRREAVQAPP